MADDSIACIIKSPIELQTGDMRTDSAKPGVFGIEVTFPRERIIILQKITFKNYYTAFLTVRLQRRVTVESDRKLLKWKTCLRNMCLMPNPHTENGAQDYFSIYRHQMLFEPDDVMTVHLILRQPSPVWLNFTVEDIKMYECDHSDGNAIRGVTSLPGRTWKQRRKKVPEDPADRVFAAEGQISHTLVGIHLILAITWGVMACQGLPDPEVVASSVQQMWVLTEMVRNNPSTARVGRFDVDGSYDVNLLSYT
uniref:nicolin-1-like n=1 Tax=Pristiophorus japonicus TaxID=55135 RepID=UPI00398EEA5F